MALENIFYNTRVDHTNDTLNNSYPVSTPLMNNSGLYGQGMEIIDTQRYQLPIFNEFKTWNTAEYPMLSVLAIMAGKLIHENIIPWTDLYDSRNSIDVPFEHLRSRDHLGTTAESGSTTNRVPSAINASTAMGGMMIWQKVARQALGAGVYRTDNLDNLTATDNLWIPSFEEALTGGAGRLHNWTATYLNNLKDWGFQADSTASGKVLLPLGFYRSGSMSRKFDTTVGATSRFVKRIDNALALRAYTPIHSTGLSGDGGAGIAIPHVYTQNSPVSFTSGGYIGTASQTFFGYKYTSGTSKRAHICFQSLLTASIASDDSVTYDQMIHMIVGIEAFYFNAAQNCFILVLDFSDSNYDNITTNTDLVNGGGASQLTAGQYYQIKAGTAGANCGAITLSTGAVHYLGDIFLAPDTTGTFTDTGAIISQISDAICLEEVNTAASSARIFGSAQVGGGSKFARCILINRHKDVPSRVGETAAFDLSASQGTYIFDPESNFNYMQYFMSKPWSTSVIAMNTNYALKTNDIAISRQRHLDTYKKDVMNALLWGKKSAHNPTLAAANEGWAATCSGIFDPELFPIKYIYMPIPMNGSVINTGTGGIYFEQWMENLTKSFHFNKVPSKTQEITVFTSKAMLSLLRKANARLGSTDYSTTGNVIGATWTTIPPNKMTLGIPVYQYDSIEGTMNFVHEPSLDFETSWPVPYYLFPEAAGKLSPRWMMFGLDKSSIEFYTHAGRPEKIYGNIQPNNQVNVVTEAIQGAHSIVLRNPSNHSVAYCPPRSR